MSKMFKYLRPYWLQVVFLLVAVGVQAWGTLQLPTMMSVIVNEGIVTNDAAMIWRQGGLMVLVAAVAAVAALTSGYFSAKISAAVGRDLRADFFRQVLSFSVREIDEFSTASLITRTTNDISTVQNTMVMMLSMMLRVPLMAVGAIVSAVALAPDMTWIIALAVGVLVGLTSTVLIIVMPKFKIYQRLQDKINLQTRESLTGLRVIRAFNNSRAEEKKFARTNEELRRVDVFANTLLALQSPIMTLVFEGASLLCIWIGVMNMQADASYLGKMMAFMQYAMQTIMSFMFLIVLLVILPRANVSAGRINEVMRKRLSIKWKKPGEAARDEETEARVEFRDVSFSYGHAEEEVLGGVSFCARAGQTTAVIGSTGSGKTTLINLLLRFYDATSGEVLVNGRNVKDYDEKTLVSKIGYVPQRAFLFSGTVASNILYGVEGLSVAEAKKRMCEAAAVAQAKDFVEKMPEGYESPISEGGTNVSGGQRQRLAIARAVAKKPEIYVFDDAFSALDMKTDKKLREALVPVTREAVVIIVAQRISTIKNADQILVLDNGKLVGKGTHAELLRKCKVYGEIAKSQLSEKEFAAEMTAANGAKASAGAMSDEKKSGRKK